jgi:hypothetical protein
MSQTQSPPRPKGLEDESGPSKKKQAELREQNKINEESSDRYGRFIDLINRARDSDIEQALRR